MKIGSFRYGWYQFHVFDDGSLASGNVWYEDAKTAAKELGLSSADILERETARVFADWKGGR